MTVREVCRHCRVQGRVVWCHVWLDSDGSHVSGILKTINEWTELPETDPCGLPMQIVYADPEKAGPVQLKPTGFYVAQYSVTFRYVCICVKWLSSEKIMLPV